MKRSASFGPIVATLLLTLCACTTEPPSVTNTGYTGTWLRGNERARTELEIKGDDAAGYKLRWTLRSIDGDREVRCTWEGQCVERFKGELTAEHQLTPSVVDGKLHVLTETTVYGEDPREESFLDEFRLRQGGTSVRAVTLEREGEPIEGRFPRRIYTKISDSVGDDGGTH